MKPINYKHMLVRPVLKIISQNQELSFQGNTYHLRYKTDDGSETFEKIKNMYIIAKRIVVVSPKHTIEPPHLILPA